MPLSTEIDGRLDDMAERRILSRERHPQLQLPAIDLVLADDEVTPTSLRNLRTAMLKLSSSIMRLLHCEHGMRRKRYVSNLSGRGTKFPCDRFGRHCAI